MRIFIIAHRVIRQIIRDRRTLALLLVAPILVLFLLYFVLTVDAFQPKVLTVALPPALETAIRQQATVSASDDLDAALKLLKDRATDAVITSDGTTITAYVEGTEAAVTVSVKKALSAAVAVYGSDTLREAVQAQLQTVLSQASGGHAAAMPQITLSSPSLSFAYLNGSESTTSFDDIAPMLMGFFIFFFVFILAGVSFLRERNSGTLERLLATPTRRYEIVLGYFFGFGAFVFAQTLLIQAFMVAVLHVTLRGDFLLVMLINLLLAASSLSLGTLLSAFARNELQMFQFIPLVVVPQVLFCGLFSMRTAPGWILWLSKMFPLTYAADALSNVALRGLGLGSIWMDLLILTGFTLVFLLLNTLALRKYRRI